MTSKNVKILLVGVLAVLTLIVIIQNSNPIFFQVLFWKTQANSLGVFLSFFLLGGATGALAVWFFGRKGSA